MKCHICNRQLSQEEIQWEKERQQWAPCYTCIQEADECFGADDDEAEIARQIELELLLQHEESMDNYNSLPDVDENSS